MLESSNAPSEDAMTLVAWSGKLSRSRERTSAWIRDGLREGWMERATIMIDTITGQPRKGIGFRVVRREGKHAKR